MSYKEIQKNKKWTNGTMNTSEYLKNKKSFKQIMYVILGCFKST